MTDVYFAHGALICFIVVVAFLLLKLLVDFIISKIPVKVIKGELIRIGFGKEYYDITLPRVPTIDDATCSVTIRDEHGKKRKFKMANAYSQSLAQADSNSKTHEAEFYVRGKRLVKVVMDGNTIGA